MWCDVVQCNLMQGKAKPLKFYCFFAGWQPMVPASSDPVYLSFVVLDLLFVSQSSRLELSFLFTI